MYAWASDELHTNSKRQAKATSAVPLPSIVPLPKPRAPRKRSALEMYMKDAPRLQGASSPGRFPINEFTASCRSQFADLTSDELAHYEAQAEELNAALARESSSQRNSTEELPAL